MSRPMERKVTNPTVSFPVIIEPRQEVLVEFQHGPDHGPGGWKCTFTGGFLAVTERGHSSSGVLATTTFRATQLYDLYEWSQCSCLLLGELTLNRGGAEPRNIRLPVFLKGANKEAMRIVTVVDPSMESVCMFPFQTLEVVFTEKYGMYPEVFGGDEQLVRIGCGSFMHTSTQVRRLEPPLCDRRLAMLRPNPWLSADSPYFPQRKSLPLISNVEHHFFQPSKQPTLRSSPRNGYQACEIKFYRREGGHVEDLETILDVRYIIDGSQWDGSKALEEARNRIDRAIIGLGSVPHFETARACRADPAAAESSTAPSLGLIPFSSVTEAMEADRRREEAVRAWLMGGSSRRTPWRSTVTDPVHEDYDFHEGEDNTFVVELTQPNGLRPEHDPGWEAGAHVASFMRRPNPFSVEVIFLDKRAEPAGDTWRYMVAITKSEVYATFEATYIGTVRFVATNVGGLNRTINLWFRGDGTTFCRRRPDETDWRTRDGRRSYGRMHCHPMIQITEDASPGLEVKHMPPPITFGTLLSMNTEQHGKKGKRKKGNGGVRVSER